VKIKPVNGRGYHVAAGMSRGDDSGRGVYGLHYDSAMYVSGKICVLMGHLLYDLYRAFAHSFRIHFPSDGSLK
jgi:hypothetical protein